MSDEGEDKQQTKNLAVRIALANAYAFVDSQRFVQSFAAQGLEDLIDQQIGLIEGTGASLRPNYLQRVDRMEADLLAALTGIEEIPPEEFAQPEPENDVNSPVSDEDE
jgi:hypothetical protein